MLTTGTRVRVTDVDSGYALVRSLSGLEGVVLEQDPTSFSQVLLGMTPVRLELTDEKEAELREYAEGIEQEYKGYVLFWEDELEEVETPVEA